MKKKSIFLGLMIAGASLFALASCKTKTKKTTDTGINPTSVITTGTDPVTTGSTPITTKPVEDNVETTALPFQGGLLLVNMKGNKALSIMHCLTNELDIYYPIYSNDGIIIGFETGVFSDYKGSNYSITLMGNLNNDLSFSYDNDVFTIKPRYGSAVFMSYDPAGPTPVVKDPMVCISKSGEVSYQNLDEYSVKDGVYTYDEKTFTLTKDKIVAENSYYKCDVTYSLEKKYEFNVFLYEKGTLISTFESSSNATSGEGTIKNYRYTSSKELKDESTDLFKLDSNKKLIEFTNWNPGYETYRSHYTYGDDGLPSLVSTYMYGQAYKNYEYEYNQYGFITKLKTIDTHKDFVFESMLTYKYDNENRIIEECSYSSETSLASKIEYIYNELGQKTEVKETSYNPSGAVISIYLTNYDFDKDGNRIGYVKYDVTTSTRKYVQIHEDIRKSGMCVSYKNVLFDSNEKITSSEIYTATYEGPNVVTKTYFSLNDNLEPYKTEYHEYYYDKLYQKTGEDVSYYDKNGNITRTEETTINKFDSTRGLISDGETYVTYYESNEIVSREKHVIKIEDDIRTTDYYHYSEGRYSLTSTVIEKYEYYSFHLYRNIYYIYSDGKLTKETIKEETKTVEEKKYTYTDGKLSLVEKYTILDGTLALTERTYYSTNTVETYAYDSDTEKLELVYRKNIMESTVNIKVSETGVTETLTVPRNTEIENFYEKVDGEYIVTKTIQSNLTYVLDKSHVYTAKILTMEYDLEAKKTIITESKTIGKYYYKDTLRLTKVYNEYTKQGNTQNVIEEEYDIDGNKIKSIETKFEYTYNSSDELDCTDAVETTNTYGDNPTMSYRTYTLNDGNYVIYSRMETYDISGEDRILIQIIVESYEYDNGNIYVLPGSYKSVTNCVGTVVKSEERYKLNNQCSSSNIIFDSKVVLDYETYTQYTYTYDSEAKDYKLVSEEPIEAFIK